MLHMPSPMLLPSTGIIQPPQLEFTSGTHLVTIGSDVTLVSAVVITGGGQRSYTFGSNVKSGGGGALGWRTFAVTPGEVLTVLAIDGGGEGSDSYGIYRDGGFTRVLAGTSAVYETPGEIYTPYDGAYRGQWGQTRSWLPSELADGGDAAGYSANGSGNNYGAASPLGPSDTSRKTYGRGSQIYVDDFANGVYPGNPRTAGIVRLIVANDGSSGTPRYYPNTNVGNL